MVAHHDALDADLDGLLGVGDGLDPLQDDGAVKVLLEELDVVPAVAEAGEDGAGPLGGGGPEVFFHLDVVSLLELRAKHRVRKTDGHADLVTPEERIVAVVHVGRAPAEDVRVERYDEGGEAILLGAPQNRHGDVVVLVRRPVKLIPPGAVAVGRGDVFDRRTARRRHDVGYTLSRRGASRGDFPVRVEDLLDAYRRDGDRKWKLAAHDLRRQIRKRVRRDQPTRYDTPFLECGAVLACGLSGPRVAHDIPFALDRKTFRRQRFPV